MKLSELLCFLSEQYGWNITVKGSRKRKIVNAKKVFAKFASDMGYGPSEIGHWLEVPHDLIIHYRKTFDAVLAVDVAAYNKCIDHFDAPLDKINGVLELTNGPMISKVMREVSQLNSKDLRFFADVVLPRFKERLENERKVKEMGKSSLV